MISAISSAMSALEANSLSFDVTANNIANINTPGFKSSSVSTAARSSGGVQVTATPTDFSQGALAQTGNPNDLTIAGPGYFRVKEQNGSTSYTRNLNVSVDPTGYLRSEGNYVLGTGGIIRVPADAQSISVSNNGVVTYISAGGYSGQAGVIDLSYFSNSQGLAANSDNTYSATPASGPPESRIPGQNGTSSITGGAVEMSNTDYATEIVNSIITQRASEANVATIKTSDQMLRTLIGMKNG